MLSKKKEIKKIEMLVSKVGSLCKEKRLTLVTAESCTGGGLAYFMTKNPDCSPILERGFVVYSNPAKESLLGVPSEILQIYGAASKAVALQMAEGALKNSIAQIAVATTGIANEDFKSLSSKKGFLWIAYAGIEKKTLAYNLNFSGSREEFELCSIAAALQNLLNYVQ